MTQHSEVASEGPRYSRGGEEEVRNSGGKQLWAALVLAGVLFILSHSPASAQEGISEEGAFGV